LLKTYVYELVFKFLQRRKFTSNTETDYPDLVEFVVFERPFRCVWQSNFSDDLTIRKTEDEQREIGRSAEGYGLVTDLVQVSCVGVRAKIIMFY
jgi:hypothetical protein